MSRVLVINSGSSSIKFQLIDMAGPRRLADGQVERIGHPDAVHTHRRRTDEGVHEVRDELAIADHGEGLSVIVDVLRSAGLAAELGAIGHRVVHGGERFSAPTLIDDEVVAGIRELSALAPLHNPSNLLGIEVARELWSDVPQVAVFDTAFHATLPAVAHRYAVPREWHDDHGVRRYGMHGTSHAYVARRAAEMLDRPPDELRVITAHLGNGASMAAVNGGRSVDTSMGMSPLEGLVMGTRSGDLDPAVIFHVGRATGLEPDDIERALNTASGLLGLCGDNDMRVVEGRARNGDPRAQLAVDLFCYRIRKYVGAYAVVLDGADALVFTAGIGEHAPAIRARVCGGLGLLGVSLDNAANERATGDHIISSADSAVAVLVVATDEELEIATSALAVAERTNARDAVG